MLFLWECDLYYFYVDAWIFSFSDYAQYISQVGTLDSGLHNLQGLHSLQSLPDGTTVAFIDSSVLDASHIFDNGAIEVHQSLPEGSVELQQVWNITYLSRFYVI